MSFIAGADRIERTAGFDREARRAALRETSVGDRPRPMNYDEAFEALIRPMFAELPEQERSRRDQRGNLAADSPQDHAVADSYHYQRSHADAFAAALHHFDVRADPDEVVGVLDLGAGAGTVAVALSEEWAIDHPPHVLYFGVEPHPTMRDLGSDLLDLVAPPWLHHRIRASTHGWAIPAVTRCYVTLSYVVHQPTLRATNLTAWAAVCRALADTVGQIKVIITTANSNHPTMRGRNQTMAFRDALKVAGLGGTGRVRAELRVDQRFPRPCRGWDVVSPGCTSEFKNVDASCWTLEPA